MSGPVESFTPSDDPENEGLRLPSFKYEQAPLDSIPLGESGQLEPLPDFRFDNEILANLFLSAWAVVPFSELVRCWANWKDSKDQDYVDLNEALSSFVFTYLKFNLHMAFTDRTRIAVGIDPVPHLGEGEMVALTQEQADALFAFFGKEPSTPNNQIKYYLDVEIYDPEAKNVKLSLAIPLNILPLGPRHPDHIAVTKDVLYWTQNGDFQLIITGVHSDPTKTDITK